MSTNGTHPQLPPGVRRLLFRAPIWLYRLRLGWLLGGRFLLLTHTGRRSGLPRQSMLEVVRHDQDSDTYLVASAWGEQADWLRNVRKTPEVEVAVGRRRLKAVALPLPREAGLAELRDYARRHPLAARLLPQLISYLGGPDDPDYDSLADYVVMVTLRPAPSSPPDGSGGATPGE